MRFSTLLLISIPIAACSPEGAVSLTGSIGNVQLQIEEQSLVTHLSGSFQAHLNLGQRASESTDVSFSAFSLIRRDTGAPAFPKEHLSVISSETLPITLHPGDSTTIQFQVGEHANPIAPMALAKDDFTSICEAGSLQIIGTMKDTANGDRPSQLSSIAFAPSGCPSQDSDIHQ